MADEPFIGSESRPDLTVDMNAKVGDMTVRQLSDILGTAPQKAKEVHEKQAFEKQIIKEQIKENIKDGLKDGIKDGVKDHKDTADHKNTKDHKEAADQKNTKDHKESVDTKNHKDGKDHKDHIKEHIKEIKEIHKEQIKEVKEIKEKDQIFDNPKSLIVDVNKSPKEQVENGPVTVNPVDPALGIDQLIQRVTGLEQQVTALQQAAGQGGGG